MRGPALSRDREAKLLHWAGRSFWGGLLSRVHAALFKLTRGRFLPKWFQGAPVLGLEVRGRKSGKLIRLPLVYSTHPDGWVVIAANGGAERDPPWVGNLKAAGSAKVHIRGREYEVVPRFLEGEEKRAVRAEYEKIYPTVSEYEQFTKRDFPVIILVSR
jgi:F420H(2)-dependent quinone reductase